MADWVSHLRTPILSSGIHHHSHGIRLLQEGPARAIQVPPLGLSAEVFTKRQFYKDCPDFLYLYQQSANRAQTLDS